MRCCWWWLTGDHRPSTGMLCFVLFVCLFVCSVFFDGDFHRGDVTFKQVYKLHDLWGGGDGVILRMSKNKLGFWWYADKELSGKPT